MPDYHFNRNIANDLLDWCREPNRKTLLLRGARQVGKSSAVRHLGRSFNHFVEVNFDEQVEVCRIFEHPDLSPQEICQQLALIYRTPIIPGETLLFLDEIQGCPAALSKLRYFYERYPELHLIAAGSLLEFAIEQILSFGVGRVRSMFMYPCSFGEFLGALGEGMLEEACRNASPSAPLPEIVHGRLVHYLKIFMVIGGMPEVVAEYLRTRDLLRCQRVLDDLLISFRDDFAKYKKQVPALRIGEVFESVAHQAAGKFVYEHAALGANNLQVKQALELLVMAGLVIPVTRTAANGIPLGAEINPKHRRMIMLDTGLFQRILGLDAAQVLVADDFKAINKGSLAEIFVGLELLKGASCYERKGLYYWQRDKSQSHAQIDYLIQRGEQIVPIEVKAGTQGAMQSLRLFMEEKQIVRGVRTSLENFARYDRIEVYPLYGVSNLVE